MKTHIRQTLAWAVLAAFASVPIAPLQAQVPIPPNTNVTPDTSKPGFIWTIFSNPGNKANNNERTEDALAGLLKDADGSLLPNLADPAAQGVASAPAAAPTSANAPISFEIPTIINVSQNAGDSHGNFPDEGQMPGVPATDGSADGMSVEILTYLELPAGVTTMGINSDDGFRLSAGNVADAFGNVVPGEFSGGRGARDSIFMISVDKPGVYPFRVTYEEGGGDANIEWFTIKADGTTKVLVNDTTNGGLKAYREKLGIIDPFIKSASPRPVPRQLEQVSSSLVVTLSDGNPKTVDDNSIVLQYNGATVTPTKARQGATVTLTYTPTGLLVPADRHTASISFKDSTGTFLRNQQWTFYNLENLILPAKPVTGENFDSYPEATSAANTVPPGWVATNYTYKETEGWDLSDIASDAYLDMVIITTDTALAREKEVLDNNKAQLVNGQPVTNWMSGNLLFSASDGRKRNIPDPDGGPNISVGQIRFVVSAPFNLSTVTNPLLTFSSGARLSGNKEQMTLEYSIDKGTNWLPALYMRNSTTVLLQPDGSFDALGMCITTDTNQIARWPTPGVGPKGGNFGDMIAAPISQALAPYFANRNDGVAARRVEAIRLPKASKQSDVRLRLTHAGSCGWEWGVDNIAFYDVPGTSTVEPPPAAKFSGIHVDGANVIIEWTGSGTLQSADTVTGPWTDVAGATSPRSVPKANAPKYYRFK